MKYFLWVALIGAVIFDTGEALRFHKARVTPNSPLRTVTHIFAGLDIANNFTALQQFSGGVSSDGSHTETIPSTTSTLVDLSSIQTLSNKTIPFTNLSGAATLAQLPGSGVTTINGTSCTIGSSCTPSPIVIAHGTVSMPTSTFSPGSCNSFVSTVSASGAVSTDVVNWSFNSSTDGQTTVLTVNAWPTTNNVNFSYCNLANAMTTPGASTLNWQVIR